MNLGRTLLVALVLGGGAYGGYAWYGETQAKQSAEAPVRWGQVTRGLVVEGVAASGTIQPLLLVQVGTQVSGVVEKLFKDFNDPVKAGETIALLDARRLKAVVVQDEASLARARADVGRVKAELARAERELARQESLSKEGFTSATDLDAAIAAAESARAQMKVAEAAVTQSMASLEIDRVNLDYATIVSPIDGVIVTRSVDVGQTVAASLSAPVIYTIANDLKRVRVEVSVPEADIGRLASGQRVRFHVDAHPDKSFEGRVREVRLSGASVSNVVTYIVVVDAENPEQLLLPGMTANATFEIARSDEDALRVPNAALRLRPAANLVEEDPGARPEGATRTAGAASAGPDGGTATAAMGGERRRGPRGEGGPRGERGPRGEGGARPSSGGGSPQIGTVYVKGASGKLKAVRVRTGLTDGVFTVVRPFREESLPEGAEVATSILVTDDAGAGAVSNPFAPSMPGGRGGGGRMGIPR